MTRRVFDLAVIGDDAAGLAAAACAARAGAKVVLVGTGRAQSSRLLEPSTPDSVWRKLALYDSAYKPVPYASRVSLFSDGGLVETFADPHRNPEGHDIGADERIWPDFWASMARQRVRREEIERAFAASRDNGPMALLAAGDTDAVTAFAGQRALPLLDDFFTTDRLKTHLASVALSPFSLGGDEPGSAFALESLAAGAAWPFTPSGPRGLRGALGAAAETAGVERCEGEVLRIDGLEEKTRTIVLRDGETVRARQVLSAGVGDAPDVLRCDLRIRFADAPPAPAGRGDSIFYLADSGAAFADARDAALTGKIPESQPLMFAMRDDIVHAAAPYCPARLHSDDDAPRDWSEQDRQAFGRQIVARLAPHLEGAARHVRRVDLSFTPAHRRGAAQRGVATPPLSHDAIGARVATALDLVNG